jgi:transcriptional regulator with XRE-family HTH domain
MSWIKNFRESYGLSQLQLAHFTGITRDYIAFIERQRHPPSNLKHLFDELQTEFENVQALADEEEDLSDPIQNAELLKDIRLRIEKKEAQLRRLSKKLAELKERQKNLKVLRKVSSNWKAKKLDTDPDILSKTGPIESGIKVEILRCGPAAQSRIRLKMARVQAEIDAAKEEIAIISPFTTL